MKISSYHTHNLLPSTFLQKPNSQQEAQASSTQNAKQEAEIAKLQERDREVRAHEQAHIAAAGGLAKGGASFTFQRGPDGKQYAIGGEVNIDTSPVSGNPEATIRKAKQIRAAALAPADPSAQDRAIAASAAALEAQAQQELKKEEHEAVVSQSDNSTSAFPPRIDLFA